MPVNHPIVARFHAEKASAKPASICGMLLAWFGGQWTATWSDPEGCFLIQGHGEQPDNRDKARYFVIGYLASERAMSEAPPIGLGSATAALIDRHGLVSLIDAAGMHCGNRSDRAAEGEYPASARGWAQAKECLRRAYVSLCNLDLSN